MDFYGSAEFNNLCSVCYKASLPKAQPKLEIPKMLPKEVVPEAPAVVVKQHCKECSRKVGLLGFKCKCEEIFCSRHRYAEEHHCPVDYRAL